MADMLPLSG